MVCEYGPHSLHHCLYDDSGVSEVFGAVILITIIAAAVGLVAVSVFSQPPPEKIPAVNFLFASKGNIITIHHNGGDPLPEGNYQILVNSYPVPSGSITKFPSPAGNWVIGDTLTIQMNDLSPSSYVQVVYLDGSASYVLASNSTPGGAGGPYAPVASFITDVSSGIAPLDVQFTDTSEYSPDSWVWEFGDGSISFTQHPVHTFTSAGTYTVRLTAENSLGSSTATRIITVSGAPVPVANFTANVTSGIVPLTVQFTDLSENNPTSWSWVFGDGNVSYQQNPQHTFVSVGNYTVSLNATNSAGSNSMTRTEYIQVSSVPFVNYVIEENVFVYGSQLRFSGAKVAGPDATVVITESLSTSDLNRGASIAVNTLYIDGDVTLDGGSAGLGSAVNPGNIYVTGDMNLLSGTRDIYGDVYVRGNLRLKDARIHGNVYVDGDVTLYWTPWLAPGSHIYYTGTLSAPAYYNQGILDKCIHQATVPGFAMPDTALPSVKSSGWYAARGYVSSGPLTDNLKIFAPGYSSSSWTSTVNDVVIIASAGDISITGLGGSGFRGVLFAPNGKATFSGGFFEGVVIARDGFDVISGGTTVTFKNLETYFTSPDDYPF
ncbi:PKD domain-containing protein [Methanoregula formicica]|uniref:PDK repeat-containing protein n=1 Tax=Methanoregula formicica (strain DSM 22288 / NBRC 105244 / SMSP) TaxID=593750 RepID=L0HDI8_METFS|nr:PKD domain-containing protein [Methanoregula formicica]AGB01856.1 PDK repeat-containing protein [Methanoregula formicica SMSP]